MTDRYQYPDFVLTVIPVTLIIAYSIGTVLNAHLIAIATAGVLCYLVMVDGLLWHAPTE